MELSSLANRRTPLLWELLGRLGLPTSSDAHGSARPHEPDPQATPVFISGFPRTGTTTAMRRLAKLLDYNCCFEPFGRNSIGDEPARFEEMHAIFRAPPANLVQVYERSGGFPGAIDSITCPKERQRLADALRGHLDQIHRHFGMNCVVKCLRAAWNLKPIAAFYHDRRTEPVWVMLETNPLSPLYTFYRIGALTENPRIPMPSVQSLYEYRIRLSELLGRHKQVRSLPCRTAAERLIVACMLEHQEQRRFARQVGRRAIVVTLGRLFEHGHRVAELCGRPVEREAGARAMPPRFASDPLFHDRVVSGLSPVIIEAIHEHYGREVPTERPSAPCSLRGRVTAFRHDLYRVKQAA